jgi:hypothetical protein
MPAEDALRVGLAVLAALVRLCQNEATPISRRTA